MDKIIITGRIEFDLPNETKKHESQASWKRIAMILIDGDIAEYYAWFLKKRYRVLLNKPLRGAHITIINDSLNDMSLNGERSIEETNMIWEQVKAKWNGKEIQVMLSIEPRTNDKNWWLNVPHEDREEIQGIRTELGLGKPYFGLHMSLGVLNDKNMKHSAYIHRLIKAGLIN